MSGLAGIYNFADTPVERHLLERMTDLVASRGDESGYWLRGPVAIGHRLLRSTPESFGEHQPLYDETSDVCLSFDGRIDNSPELQAAMLAHGVATRNKTDAELVLRAYQCWGEHSVERLLGDFAFALWDARDRRLLCARDALGIRPLYYFVDSHRFVWGSEIRQIFASGALTPRPNPGMIGEYLSDRPNHLEETLYVGVMRLPPATVLMVRNGQRRLRRYFELDPGKEIRYPDDASYADHFRELFAECVNSRLRSQSAVSIFLSGGVDSSAIAGTAQAILGRERTGRAGVAFLSLTSSRPEANERFFAMDVGRFWQRRVRFVDGDSYVPPALDDQVRQFRDFPDAPNLSPWGLLVAEALAAGSRVVLWGHGGDEWLTGDSLHCGDMLRELRLAGALQQVRHDLNVSARWGGGVGLRDAARWLLLPIVPELLKAVLRPVARHFSVPAWIRPEFAREVGLRDRFRGDASRVPKFPTAAQTVIAASFHGGRAVLEREILDRFGASFSIEQRFPFHDRRLIEFALAIPEDQRWRADQTKFVLRQALGDLLPASVSRRTSKAEFSYMFADSLRREGTDRVFRALRLADEGYVDPRVVQQMYTRSQMRPGPDLSAAWTILATERWYRVMFCGGEG